jgi:hypothetical protein
VAAAFMALPVLSCGHRIRSVFFFSLVDLVAVARCWERAGVLDEVFTARRSNDWQLPRGLARLPVAVLVVTRSFMAAA